MAKSFLEILVRWILWALISLVGYTTRKTWINKHCLDFFDREGRNFILSIWHNHTFYFVHIFRRRGMVSLVSASRDGNLSAWIQTRMGFLALRGSSTRGGVTVLRSFLRVLREGRSVAITPDGSTGPRYILKLGVVTLAKSTGVPILPVGFAGKRVFEFRSWDRMKVPYPFSRVVLYVGEPIWIGQEKIDDETLRQKVERAMREAVAIADRFAGGKLVEREPLLAEVLPQTPESAPRTGTGVSPGIFKSVDPEKSGG